VELSGLIREQLEQCFRGPAWHGPSLTEVLAGVGDSAASARPLTAHSIAEIAAHAAAWKRVVAGWARGGEWQEVPPELDWPSPAAWPESRSGLERAHEDLVGLVGDLDAAALSRRVGETSLAQAIFGVAHHDLYHAGQIALLRKAVPGT